MAANLAELKERLSSELTQLRNRTIEWLETQEWFQSLKSKWDDLDPQSRTYLRVAGLGGGVLIFVIITVSLVWVSSSMKREYNDKVDALAMIRSANEELQRLRENSAGASVADTGGGESAWPTYFQSSASQAGLSAEQVAVTGNQPAAGGTELSTETIYEIGLKKVNLKRLVKYAIQLENGPRPVRLRTVNIDTGGDPDGWLNARFTVSTFTVSSK